MTYAQTTLEAFTSAVAEHSPVPGGGAVAAITLAQGAALGAMVVAYSVGKKPFKDLPDDKPIVWEGQRFKNKARLKRFRDKQKGKGYLAKRQ